MPAFNLPQLPPDPYADNPNGSALRRLSLHFGRPAIGSEGLYYHGVIKHRLPTDWEDGATGQVLDGVWFPGSDIVEVDGKMYGRPYAPDPRNERYDT